MLVKFVNVAPFFAVNLRMIENWLFILAVIAVLMIPGPGNALVVLHINMVRLEPVYIYPPFCWVTSMPLMSGPC